MSRISDIKISVIVPVFNARCFLKNCLDSIINQTCKGIEIICIDDGSTDGSSDILDAFATEQNSIRVFHKANEGYGKAINYGLENARGEYIGIVESDDTILPEMYEKLYNAAKKSDADIAKCDYFRVFDFGGYEYKVRCNVAYEKDLVGKSFSQNAELIKNERATWVGIYRREFLTENAIYHNETTGASFQDNGFWFQTMVLAKGIVYIDYAGYKYRIDNENASTFSKSKDHVMIEEYDYLRNRLKQRGIWEQVKTAYYWARETVLQEEIGRVAAENTKDIVSVIDLDFKEMMKEHIDLSFFEPVLRDKIIYELSNKREFIETIVSDKNMLNIYLEAVRNVFVFGDGFLGYSCIDFINKYGRRNINIAFLTEDSANGHGQEGMPYISITDAEVFRGKCLVIIAVSVMEQEGVRKILNMHHLNNIMTVQQFVNYKGCSRIDKINLISSLV